MRLVVVRHADAGDREAFAKTGKSDDLRPLSEKGRKQMKGASKGLRALVPGADLIVTSPLTRAVQTAKIVAVAYDDVQQETSARFEDTDAEDLRIWDVSPNRSSKGKALVAT